MNEFINREELKAIHEHAECGFPFGEAEEDVIKLLRYVGFLENMPFIQTIVKFQEENERLNEKLKRNHEAIQILNRGLSEKRNEAERLRQLFKKLQSVTGQAKNFPIEYEDFVQRIARQALEGTNP